jgi:PPOX class probable F420-dependent enzyme
MPGYGVREDAEGILPWPWARERLENTRNYWLATTRPDGRPHVMAVWGLWLGDRFWFSTAITSTKARNLATNPALAISTESGAEAVVLEGAAELVEDKATLKPVWDAYKAKYNWPMEGESMFAVRPATVFAFIETAESFGSTATRWRFHA